MDDKLNEEKIINIVEDFNNISTIYGVTIGFTIDQFASYQQGTKQLLKLYNKEKIEKDNIKNIIIEKINKITKDINDLENYYNQMDGGTFAMATRSIIDKYEFAKDMLLDILKKENNK